PTISSQHESFEENKIMFDDFASKVPMTAIFGYASAGKTAVANFLVQNMQKQDPQRRIGWIRNVDPASSREETESPEMARHEGVVATTIATGCIFCIARAQFVKHIKYM